MTEPTYCRPTTISLVAQLAQLPSVIVKEAVDPQHTDAKTATSEDETAERERRARAEIRKRFSGFTEEVQAGTSLEAQTFKQLIGLFGAESAVDVLYQYKPEFKGKVDMPRVKSFLADYLGEFTVAPGEIDFTHLEEGLPLLSNSNLQKSLTEVVKRHCLRKYHETIRRDRTLDDFDVIAEYIDEVRKEVESLGVKSRELDSVLQTVEDYYLSLFELKIPEKFVDVLRDDRPFPDLNQRINIRETLTNRRQLIGDDPGMGKSASAIMTKEIAGAKCAVIVTPSAVLESGVWQGYLGAQSEDNPNGNFKSGQEPRVLVVKNMESLQRVSADDYDYILISQEKINDGYTNALKAIDYDMLVLDEAHKFKNVLEGARPDKILQLADKIEGPNKYLMMLTATPAPNKVADIALTLRLLHPKTFAKHTNEQLVHEIVKGDILDIRSLLLPRMQNKRIADFIDIQPPNEQTVEITMTEAQRVVYDVLLEEYELTATEKLMALRQFLLNPQIFDPTPDLEPGKIATTSEQLADAFQRHDKVLMFVNDFVNGVIVGDQTILDQMELPEGVRTGIIHGDVTKKKRRELLEQFQSTDGKMLLVVSGQTVSVGVDLMAAGEVVMYNQPWTLPEEIQQIGRAQRPSRKGTLDVVRLITPDTIEDGINRYIIAKYQAVEKLMYGMPLTEIERNIVAAEEKPDCETAMVVNGQLADTYYSSMDRMNRMFGQVKGIGQAGLLGENGFLAQHGEEYAASYLDLTSRSYQANVSRATATIVKRIVQEAAPEDKPVIVDIGAGPEMLRRHIADELQDSVISLDINPRQLQGGAGKRVAATMANLPLRSGSVDVANMALTYHYSGWSERKQDFERLGVLSELNRVLKPGGTALITMPYSLDFKNEGAFFGVLRQLGFSVAEEHTGLALAGESFRAQTIALRKEAECQHSVKALLKQLRSATRTLSQDETDEEPASGGVVEALRIVKVEGGLRDSRKIISNFSLGDRLLPVAFNAEDRKTLEEERRAVAEMESLQQEHGGIGDIPAEQIAAGGFARLFVNKRYILFRKLTLGNGAVVVRDSKPH